MDSFSTLLSNATSRYRADDMGRDGLMGSMEPYEQYGGSTYNLYFNNGLMRRISKEAFYEEKCSFRYEPEPPTEPSVRLTFEQAKITVAAHNAPVELAAEKPVPAPAAKPVPAAKSAPPVPKDEPAARTTQTVQQAIQTAQKNRREALLGQIVGLGIGILLYVLLAPLLR